MRKPYVVIIIVLLVITLAWAYWQHSFQRPFLEVGKIRTLSLFPDGKIVVVSNIPDTNIGSLAVYSPNGTLLWNLTFGENGAYWDSVLYAKVSPDGKHIGVITRNKFMIYEENGTLLWERKNPLSGRLWSEGPQWASVQFTDDSRYVAFGATASKSIFWVFSINGSPLLNGTAEGITGMKVSTEGVYLMENHLFSTSGVRGSKILHYGFNKSNWSLEFPSGSPRAIDVLKTANGTYVAYADCALGVTLIKNGTVLWNRDKGTCYWDVAFWYGKIYAATTTGLVNVYSLDGRLLSRILTPESGIPTLLPAPTKILLLQKIVLPPDNKRWVVDVFTMNSTGDAIKVGSLEGFPAGDFSSHITADYRKGELVLGVKESGKDEKYGVYVIFVD